MSIFDTSISLKVITIRLQLLIRATSYQKPKKKYTIFKGILIFDTSKKNSRLRLFHFVLSTKHE